MNTSDSFEDRLLGVLEPLLDALRGFEWSSRNLGMHGVPQILDRLAEVKTTLLMATSLMKQDEWPDGTQAVYEPLSSSYKLVLERLDSLDQIERDASAMYSLYRILGIRSRIYEAIFPLAQHFSIVHRFFLNENKQKTPRFSVSDLKEDAAETGVHHFENDRRQKGGFSVYVPESYDPKNRYPLICAMHGGSGHGSTFLWSWLRAARSEQLIVVAPTSVGDTWALMGEDIDSPNLDNILSKLKSALSLDESKMLLTGMSDGGTFTYVSGCLENSPFTHLAPCSASFHPLLIEMMSQERLAGLPIHITHGVLDWMFPVDVAQTAEYSLRSAGASVTYREIADLAHAYPEDGNPEIIDWFLSVR